MLNSIGTRKTNKSIQDWPLVVSRIRPRLASSGLETKTNTDFECVLFRKDHSVRQCQNFLLIAIDKEDTDKLVGITGLALISIYQFCRYIFIMGQDYNGEIYL